MPRYQRKQNFCGNLKWRRYNVIKQPKHSGVQGDLVILVFVDCYAKNETQTVSDSPFSVLSVSKSLTMCSNCCEI